MPGGIIVMNRDWKFTWEVEVAGKTFSRETHRNFEGFAHLKPFVLKISEIRGSGEFYFPIQIGEKPIFFRKVYGKCGLNSMINQVTKVVNCFGVESEDSSNKKIVWECDNKYYFVDDIADYMRLT